MIFSTKEITMPFEQFVDINFRPATLRVIEQANWDDVSDFAHSIGDDNA